MSDGVLVDLRLSVPVEAWRTLASTRIGDAALRKGWSRLKSARLEQRLGRPHGADVTFEAMLERPAFHRPPSVHRVETHDARTTLRVCLVLDSSLLELCSPLASMLFAARVHDGSGALRIVEEGDSEDAEGVVLTLAEGEVTAEQADDPAAIASELRAALTGQKPGAERAFAIDPFTGQRTPLRGPRGALED